MGSIPLIALMIGGLSDAAFYYFKVLKPKKDAAKGTDNLDEYVFDEYEDEKEQPEESDDGNDAKYEVENQIL